MGDVDPEDTESLDSNDGAIPAGEENRSSDSDAVHLEREEADMLEEAAEEERARRTEEEDEEDEELQTSVLSVLGGEEEEERDPRAPETEELPVSAEEPRVAKAVPPLAPPPLPIVRFHPPSATSTPVPSTATSEAEELHSTRGLRPPSILAPMAAEPLVDSLERLPFSQIPLSSVEEHSVEASRAAPEKPEPSALPKTARPLSSTELLCGGAALVAVAGVAAYAAVAYCRK